MSAPAFLAFDDRRTNGWYAVRGNGGEPVAWIGALGWRAARFDAMTPAGEPLCSGRHRGYLSRWWDLHDASGRPIASMRSSASGLHRHVHLPDGGSLRLDGQWMARAWTLYDPRGAVLVSSVPTSSAWSWWHPDAWAVQVHDRSLHLAQVVAVVAAHRIIVKHTRS